MNELIPQNELSEGIVRRVLKHDVTILISIIIGVYSFISMVILPIQKLQQEIDTIKNNGLVHVETALKEQADANLKQDDKINEIDKKLERVITILESVKK